MAGCRIVDCKSIKKKKKIEHKVNAYAPHVDEHSSALPESTYTG